MKRFALTLLLAAMVISVCGCGQSAANRNQYDSDWVPDTARSSSSDQATEDHAGLDATDDQLTDMQKLHPMNLKIDTGFFSTPLRHSEAMLDTEELLQNPELPTGCESVATTSALRVLGFDMEKTDFAENYLTFGEDVMWDYVGDPAEEDGAGIFPPGLTNCTNDFLRQQHSKYVAYNTMGVPFEDLFKLIDAGYPVVMWTTMDYELPILDDVAYEYEDEYYYWYQLEHCVMLCGYDLGERTVTINDPLEGIVVLGMDQMEEIYNETGKLSMTIKDKDTAGTVHRTDPAETAATAPEYETVPVVSHKNYH